MNQGLIWDAVCYCDLTESASNKGRKGGKQLLFLLIFHIENFRDFRYFHFFQFDEKKCVHPNPKVEIEYVHPSTGPSWPELYRFGFRLSIILVVCFCAATHSTPNQSWIGGKYWVVWVFGCLIWWKFVGMYMGVNFKGWKVIPTYLLIIVL